VKLGPFGKTERGVDVVDALSSVMVAGWPRNGRGDVCAMRRR
jgi:hypothetical protein